MSSHFLGAALGWGRISTGVFGVDDLLEAGGCGAPACPGVGASLVQFPRH